MYMSKRERERERESARERETLENVFTQIIAWAFNGQVADTFAITILKSHMLKKCPH